MIGYRIWFLVVGCLLSFTQLQCNGNSSDQAVCPQGQEGCACWPDSFCNDELVCDAIDICRDIPSSKEDNNEEEDVESSGDEDENSSKDNDDMNSQDVDDDDDDDGEEEKNNDNDDNDGDNDEDESQVEEDDDDEEDEQDDDDDDEQDNDDSAEEEDDDTSEDDEESEANDEDEEDDDDQEDSDEEDEEESSSDESADDTESEEEEDTGPDTDISQEVPYGYIPTTAKLSDSIRAYEEWKDVHLEDCGGGVHRVRWENAKLDATVSEGIGYGMLLTVAFDDREAFDGLFEYYNMALDEYGLMHWLRYGCDAHREETYNEYPDNAAADADLDVAMALIQASCKWDSSYGDDATRVINAIGAHMVTEHEGELVLKAGDSTWFTVDCINYSYFTPAYYRSFAAHVPGDAAFWNQLADDTYKQLDRASDPDTGLVRNWGASAGGSVWGCEYAYSDDYGDDASRTPWRIATDYIWWGTPEAKDWTDKMTDWLMTQDPAGLGQWYKLDGSFQTDHEGYDDHTAITLGPWSVGAMTHSQEAVDILAAELVAIPTGDGEHDAEYFNRMLRALSLIMLTGYATPCGGTW